MNIFRSTFNQEHIKFCFYTKIYECWGGWLEGKVIILMTNNVLESEDMVTSLSSSAHLLVFDVGSRSL